MQSAPKEGTPSHSTFRAYQIRRDGPMTSGLARLALADLSPGDVVIRTAYAGVNYKDALATTEQGNVIRKLPRVAGSDASGWIVASGDRRFREGDEVAVLGRGFGVDHDGGFSEYLRIPADWVIKLPGGFALRDAATLGIAGYTAALAVHLLQEARCQPERGEILVNGATGAVSGMAIEMLARLQYRVAAVSAKPDRAAYLQTLGAQAVLGATDLVDQGRPLEPARWAGGLDALGGKPLDLMLRSIMPRGCVASFGNVAGNDLSTNVLPFILRGVRLIGVNLTYYLDLEAELWARLAGDLRPQHTIEQVKTITLDGLAQQLQYMLDGQSWGRTIVEFPA